MSLDSQLDRSKLERKDRDELATIVTTLGGKPGRSKKSDLVEMILELTSGAGEEPASRGRRARTAAEPATNGAEDAETRTARDGTDCGRARGLRALPAPEPATVATRRWAATKAVGSAGVDPAVSEVRQTVGRAVTPTPAPTAPQ